MIPDSHPYWQVRRIVAARADIATLKMSYYSYRPQTVEDERIEWRVSAAKFLSTEEVELFIKDTPSGHELAIHSDVTLNDGHRMHILMVDMSTSAKAHLDKLRVYLGDHLYQQITWYSSGRSFHGYGDSLLTESDWVRFMGLLLLANMPRLEPTVDPRWVGHRLLAGYSALRWTRNTSHYILPPAKLELQVGSKGVSSEVGAVGRPLRR